MPTGSRPRTVITIQARMRSERLPGKVLLCAAGKPFLEHMIERLRRVRLADDIVVATTTDPSCDPIAELAKRLDVRCHRGSEEDVLQRVLDAAHAARASVLVETTGDCPLIDPAIVDRVIETFLSSDVDYCSNILRRTYPRGMDVQVFPVRILEEVAELTTDPADREHVSLYIYEHPGRFRLRDVGSDLSTTDVALRLTLDTPEDLILIRELFERLYPQNPTFALSDVLRLLAAEPALRSLNAKIEQKAVR